MSSGFQSNPEDQSQAQFPSWDSVSAAYGSPVASYLQSQNIPLAQVNQFLGQNSLGAPITLQNPLNFGGGFGGGPPQMQGPSFDPTQNPNYPTELLGAQALQAVGLNPKRQVTVNPSPADTPSSSQFAQSGVSSVASPQTIQYSAKTPMPQTSQTPSIFSPATPLQFSPYTTAPLSPWPQYNAQNMPRQYARAPETGAGTPYAAPPPTTPVSPPPAPTAPTAGYGGGQILGFNQGRGNTTPTPGMNAPSPNANVQDKLLSALPHYQDGGIAGLDGPEVAVLGESGPEQVTPLTGDGGGDPISDPSFSQIGTQVPIGGDSGQAGFDSSLYDTGQQPNQPPQQTYVQPQQPPSAPTNATANSLTGPGMSSFHQMPAEHQPANMYGAPAANQARASNQPGPPTPPGYQPTGQVGPPNPPGQQPNTQQQQPQQNKIPSAADRAKQQAIKNVLAQAGEIGKAMQGTKNAWKPIQSAIPQPPPAPGVVQMQPPALTNQNQNQSLAQRQAQLAAYNS